jgi:hypothetical protein
MLCIVSLLLTAAPPLPVTDGLIAFWDFQEPQGSARRSKWPLHPPQPLVLHEAFFDPHNSSSPQINGTGSGIARASGGIFGPFSASLKYGQMFVAPRSESPALSKELSGPYAKMSMVAWVMKDSIDSKQKGMEFIAGAWAEDIKARQFSMFFDLFKGNMSHLLDFEVSSVGGATPGYPWCVTRAIGTRPVPQKVWNCAGLTYDGEWISGYNNGTLELRGNGTGTENTYSNPMRAPGGIYDAGKNEGANFTVGSNVCKSPACFEGRIAGLAVFNRSLSPDEMHRICSQTMPQLQQQLQ